MQCTTEIVAKCSATAKLERATKSADEIQKETSQKCEGLALKCRGVSNVEKMKPTSEL